MSDRFSGTAQWTRSITFENLECSQVVGLLVPVSFKSR